MKLVRKILKPILVLVLVVVFLLSLLVGPLRLIGNTKETSYSYFTYSVEGFPYTFREYKDKICLVKDNKEFECQIEGNQISVTIENVKIDAVKAEDGLSIDIVSMEEIVVSGPELMAARQSSDLSLFSVTQDEPSVTEGEEVTPEGSEEDVPNETPEVGGEEVPSEPTDPGDGKGLEPETPTVEATLARSEEAVIVINTESIVFSDYIMKPLGLDRFEEIIGKHYFTAIFSSLSGSLFATLVYLFIKKGKKRGRKNKNRIPVASIITQIPNPQGRPNPTQGDHKLKF